MKVRRSRAPLLGRQRVHPPRRRLGEAVAVRDVRLDVEDLRGGRRGRRLRIGTRAASPRSARTGVPSRRSTPRTRSVRCWTESRRTEDSPSGVGRSGERVARTPRRPPRGGDTTGRQPRERCSRVMSQMRSKPCRWARRRELLPQAHHLRRCGGVGRVLKVGRWRRPRGPARQPRGASRREARPSPSRGLRAPPGPCEGSPTGSPPAARPPARLRPQQPMHTLPAEGSRNDLGRGCVERRWAQAPPARRARRAVGVHAAGARTS